MARAVLIGLAVCSLLVVGSPALAERDQRADRRPHKVWPRTVYPPAAALRSAQRFAASQGEVSFAVIDRSLGLRGYDYDRQYSSARLLSTTAVSGWSGPRSRSLRASASLQNGSASA